MVYFLAASLVFPRTKQNWTNLDDHYWSRKRFVVSGMLFGNLAMDSFMLSRAIPEWDDWMIYFYFLLYLAALVGLIFSRSRRNDFVLLGWQFSSTSPREAMLFQARAGDSRSD